MAISKQDRNVGITVALVLLVCIVSLIAIGSTLISLISPGITRIAELLGAGLRVTTVDYNFAVGPAILPPVSSTSSSATSSTATVDPDKLIINQPLVRPLSAAQQAAIGKSANLAERLLPKDSQTPLKVVGHIYVPKLGIYSPILAGSNYGEIMSAGMALHPNSITPNEGEWGIICERSYFAAFDPRSCLFLDELTAEDQVWLIIANTVYKYQIVDPLADLVDQTEVENYSLLGKTLRIITSDLVPQKLQILIAAPVID